MSIENKSDQSNYPIENLNATLISAHILFYSYHYKLNKNKVLTVFRKTGVNSLYNRYIVCAGKESFRKQGIHPQVGFSITQASKAAYNFGLAAGFVLRSKFHIFCTAIASLLLCHFKIDVDRSTIDDILLRLRHYCFICLFAAREKPGRVRSPLGIAAIHK